MCIRLFPVKINNEAVLIIVLLLMMIICSSGCGIFTAESDKAVTEGDLVAFYDFEEGRGRVIRDRSGYGNDGQIQGASWIRGKNGYALGFTGALAYVDCGDNSNLTSDKNLTITLWVKANSSKRNQYLVGKENWSFYLWRGSVPCFATRGDNDTRMLSRASRPIAVDEWEFIGVVFNFETKEYTIYINGQAATNPVICGDGFFGPARSENLLLGRDPNKGPGFDGLLDEVRIYSRSLSQDEIKRLYEQEKEAIEKSCFSLPMLIRQAVLPGQGETIVQIYTAEEQQITPGIQAEVLLKSAEKDQAFSRQVVDIAPSSSPVELRLSLAGLETGDYDLITTITDTEGKLLTWQALPFVLSQKPWWLGTKAGNSDEVVSPWIPLQVSGKSDGGSKLSVECLGRVYEFGPIPLLTRIETAKKNVLSGPIRLVAQVEGRKVQWQDGRIKTIMETPGRVSLLQTAQGDKLGLEVTTEIEYDGFSRIDMSVNAQEPVQLEQLTIEIPLKLEHAVYLYPSPPEWGSLEKTSVLPANGVSGRFRPYIWLGDNDRGLGWYAESDQGWINEAPNQAVEVVRENGKVVIKVNLVSKSISLGGKGNPGSLSFTFGIQATPVKPISKDAWDYRICHITQSGSRDFRLKIPDTQLDELARAGVKTIVFHEHWTDIESYIETPYADDLKNLVKRCHSRDIQLLLYFGYLISDLAPEYSALGEECIRMGLSGYMPWNYPPQPIQNAYLVCYNSVWRDCIVAGIAKVMDEYDCDGVYLDGMQRVWGCRNLDHGCGYRHSDGSVHATFPIWGVRQMMKRIYTIVKTSKSEGQINVHNSGNMVMPTLGWATSNFHGEQFTWVKSGTSVTDVISLDMFRAEFMGRQWGVPSEFLNVGGFNFKESLAITLLHDIPIRAIGIGNDLNLMSSLWRLRDRFGAKQADWLPYYENAEYVKVEPKGCYISFYRHPQNGILAVVSNLSEHEAEVTGEFDFKLLGLTGTVMAMDGLTEEPIQLNNRKAKIILPKMGWKMIWLRSHK